MRGALHRTSHLEAGRCKPVAFRGRSNLGVVLQSALPEDARRNIGDWFRCIGGALPEADFLSWMERVGFRDVEVLAKGRNARTGHALSLCAVIRASKPPRSRG